MSRNRVLGGPLQVSRTTKSLTTEYIVDIYAVDAALGSPVVITLDPNAAEADQVTVQDVGNNAGAQPIVILASPGQEIINGFGSTLTISTDGGGAQLTFRDGGWIPQAIGSHGGSATSTSSVIFRPGVPTVPPAYATAAEIATLITAADGDILVEIDNTIIAPAPALWDQQVDGQGRLVLSGAQVNSGPNDLLLIEDGSFINNVREIMEGLTVQVDSRTAPGITQQNGQVLIMERGAQVQLAPTATQPGVFCPQGAFFLMVTIGSAPPFDANGTGLAVVQCGAGGFQIGLLAFSLITPGTGPFFDGIFAGPADAQFLYLHDDTAPGSPILPAWQGPVNAINFLVSSASQEAYDDATHAPSLLQTTLTANFVQPAPWAAVTVSIASTQGLYPRDWIAISTAGQYLVDSIVDPVTAVIRPVPTNPPGAGTGTTIVAPQVIARPQGGSVQNAIDVLKARPAFLQLIGETRVPPAPPYVNTTNLYQPILSIPITMQGNTRLSIAGGGSGMSSTLSDVFWRLAVDGVKVCDAQLTPAAGIATTSFSGSAVIGPLSPGLHTVTLDMRNTNAPVQSTTVDSTVEGQYASLTAAEVVN